MMTMLNMGTGSARSRSDFANPGPDLLSADRFAVFSEPSASNVRITDTDASWGSGVQPRMFRIR